MVMKKIITLIIFNFYLIIAQAPKEIQQAKDYMNKMGLTVKEAKEIAKNNGYSDKQIESAIKKNKDDSKINSKPEEIDLSKLESFSIPTTDNKNVRQDNSLLLIESKEQTQIEKTTLKNSLLSKNEDLIYFGYATFEGDPSLFQGSSVGALNPEYLIGPGDEIIIMLWGETQFRQVFSVNREGFIFIPEIGQVFVNGLNLNLLESKLYKVLSQAYASLNPAIDKPTTFLDISLGNLRPLRIQVMGEVAQPGAYVVSPSATLFSALYYFNGPTTLGSLRDIQLIRRGKKIASIDFYDYLLTGEKIKDQNLQLDDVIFIPRRLKTVRIEGEINREGIYELKPEEHLSDLISISGDLKVTAYLGRTQIERIAPFKERIELGKDRILLDVDLKDVLKNESLIQLQDGDQIKVYSIQEKIQNIVTIDGAISRPGAYQLSKMLKISDLIKKADGINSDAFLDRFNITRINDDLTERLIQLNLKKALSLDPLHNIYLKEFDKIEIFATSKMVTGNFVSIEGYARVKGRFPLKENMKIYDLLFLAGGFFDDKFKNRAYLKRADLFRFNKNQITRKIISFNLGEVLSSSTSNENLLLEPGDIIKIYKKDLFISEKYVLIDGDVVIPGNKVYKTNMTLKDILLSSGGLKGGFESYKVEIAKRDTSKQSLKKYADIISFNIDNNYRVSQVEKLLKFKNLFLKVDSNFVISPFDLITIKADIYFKGFKEIIISGEVLYPGKYVILSPSDKITDIINRAGGLRPLAYPESSQYIRNGQKINISLSSILKNPDSNLNFSVQDNDKINIGSQPKTVIVKGEANKTGINKFVPGKNLNYYLKQAGGLTRYADKNHIWIEYPNGDSKKYRRFSIFYPEIIDGTVIVIGKKEEMEPFDKTEFAKELTTILANLAQAVAVVVLAGR